MNIRVCVVDIGGSAEERGHFGVQAARPPIGIFPKGNINQPKCVTFVALKISFSQR
jgi:hypothetical protein